MKKMDVTEEDLVTGGMVLGFIAGAFISSKVIKAKMKWYMKRAQKKIEKERKKNGFGMPCSCGMGGMGMGSMGMGSSFDNGFGKGELPPYDSKLGMM